MKESKRHILLKEEAKKILLDMGFSNQEIFYEYPNPIIKDKIEKEKEVI